MASRKRPTTDDGPPAKRMKEAPSLKASQTTKPEISAANKKIQKYQQGKIKLRLQEKTRTIKKLEKQIKKLERNLSHNVKRVGVIDSVWNELTFSLAALLPRLQAHVGTSSSSSSAMETSDTDDGKGKNDNSDEKVGGDSGLKPLLLRMLSSGHDSQDLDKELQQLEDEDTQHAEAKKEKVDNEYADEETEDEEEEEQLDAINKILAEKKAKIQEVIDTVCQIVDAYERKEGVLATGSPVPPSTTTLESFPETSSPSSRVVRLQSQLEVASAQLLQQKKLCSKYRLRMFVSRARAKELDQQLYDSQSSLTRLERKYDRLLQQTEQLETSLASASQSSPSSSTSSAFANGMQPDSGNSNNNSQNAYGKESGSIASSSADSAQISAPELDNLKDELKQTKDDLADALVLSEERSQAQDKLSNEIIELRLQLNSLESRPASDALVERSSRFRQLQAIAQQQKDECVITKRALERVESELIECHTARTLDYSNYQQALSQLHQTFTEANNKSQEQENKLTNQITNLEDELTKLKTSCRCNNISATSSAFFEEIAAENRRSQAEIASLKLQLKVLSESKDSTGNLLTLYKQLLRERKEAEGKEEKTKQILAAFNSAPEEIRTLASVRASEQQLEEKTQTLQQEIEMLKKEKQADQSTLQRKVTELEEQVEELSSFQEVCDALQAEMTDMTEQLAESQTQINRLMIEATERENEKSKLVGERIKNTRKQKASQQLLLAVETKLKALEEVEAEQKAVIRQHQETHKSQEDQVKKLTEQIRLLERNNQQTRLSMNEHNASIAHISSQKHEVEAQLSSTQNQLEDEIKEKEAKSRRVLSLRDKVNSLQRKLEREKKFRDKKQYLLPSSLSDVETELKLLKTRLRCIVCKDKEKDTVITRCGHLCCHDCIERNLSTRHRKCPGCGKVFSQSDVKRVYIE